MSADLHPAVAELADDLTDERLTVAAAVVTAGLTALSGAVVAELTDDFGPMRRDADLGRLLSAHVALWAAGDLDTLAASNAAWRRNGCRDCARRALQTGEAESFCNLCSFNRTAREARS